MAVNVDGCPTVCRIKDIILECRQDRHRGGQGHVIEYRGSAIECCPNKGRMTICNMSIEAGASRAGMVPDETTHAFLRGRPSRTTGAQWDRTSPR